MNRNKMLLVQEQLLGWLVFLLGTVLVATSGAHHFLSHTALRKPGLLIDCSSQGWGCVGSGQWFLGPELLCPLRASAAAQAVSQASRSLASHVGSKGSC